MKVNFLVKQELEELLCAVVHDDTKGKIDEISFIDSVESVSSIDSRVIVLVAEILPAEIADKVVHLPINTITNALMVRTATGRGVSLSKIIQREQTSCFFDLS